jgi:Tfp pilus assembly PilM family ATPase
MARHSSTIKTVLELGTYELRLLTLESARAGEVRLKKCLSTTTPKDFVASTYIENPIIDPQPLQTALQSLIRESKLPYENTLMLMPDHSALINLMVTPPRYSRKEMDEAIKEDFVPIMPMPYENCHVVQQSIGSWEEVEIVLAIAQDRNNLLEAGGIVQKDGQNPEVVDLNILNTANMN